MKTFKARDIRRKEWSDLTDQKDVDLALDYLENVAGWVRSEEVPLGPAGGRLTKRYVLNPKIDIIKSKPV